MARPCVSGRKWINLNLKLVLLTYFSYCQQMFCCLGKIFYCQQNNGLLILVAKNKSVFSQPACLDKCLGKVAVMITCHKTGDML